MEPINTEDEALAGVWSPHIMDSYSQNSGWYSLVFKPFTKQYDKNADWFDNKGLQAVRKKLPKGIQIITKEILSAKTHINVLISTEEDMCEKFSGAVILNKYKVYCEPCIDKGKWCRYIFKEGKVRQFKRLKDYYIYDPIWEQRKFITKGVESQSSGTAQQRAAATRQLSLAVRVV